MGDIVAADDSVSDKKGCVKPIIDCQNNTTITTEIELLVSSSISGTGGKELGQRTLRSLKRGLGRIWKRHRGNASITEYDPCYKVAYLGNVLTGWAKGEGCVEKPISTLWRNYVSSNRPDVTMRLTVTNGGLTATTKDHGLTEYWAHRVTYCAAPVSHPRLFVWIYKHEGRRLRPELRCHAVLCSKESTAKRLASILNTRLHQALIEFRRDKVSRQNARLSLANSVYENPSLPRRKILLSTGGQNYRPPLERSKSAPKLSAIEEDSVAEEIEQKRLLEELRSLENVARCWEDQDGWRLARLVDALNRAGASSEYLDENASISSGCETASTSNSEERALGIDDPNNGIVDPESRSGISRIFNRRRVLFTDSDPEDIIQSSAPSNNDVKSDNEFCSSSLCSSSSSSSTSSSSSSSSSNCCSTSSPCSSLSSSSLIGCSVGNKRFINCGRTIGNRKVSSSIIVGDDDDLMPEDNKKSKTINQSSNPVFEFEDNQVFNEVVDYRPHGGESSAGGLENTKTGRRIEVKAASPETIIPPTTPPDELYSTNPAANVAVVDDDDDDNDKTDKLFKKITTTVKKKTSFITLDSLDEEEADSDESGYVEAPPKALLDINNDSSSDKFIDSNNDLSKKNNIQSDKNYYLSSNQDEPSQLLLNDNTRSDENITNKMINNCNKIIQDSILKHKDNNGNREIVDYITCPISETIKKLANASLKNSKSIDLSKNNCLKALNTFRHTKSFDGIKTPINYDNESSPSLDQRKQLLAKQGVKV